MTDGHRITIEVGGSVITNTQHPVTLTVDNDRISEDDHLSIKVTHEGVIIELWDDAANAYRASQQFLFCDYATVSAHPVGES